MWDLIFLVLITLFIVMSATAGGNPHNHQFGGDSSLYYQQHSRYPYGAWWIPFSDPSQKCHQIARSQCHQKYFYDDCYQRVLKKCNKENPGLCPTDLIAW